MAAAGIPVFAWKGETEEEANWCIEQTILKGGQPWDANWVHTVDFPMVAQDGVMDLDGEPFANTFHYPLTEDGRRFRYIGFVEAFDWRCAIHLFFDPVEQRALQTFDWT